MMEKNMMKRMLGFLIVVLCATSVFAANEWTGLGGDDLWTNPGNWTLDYPDTGNQMKVNGDGEVVEVVSGDNITVDRMIFMDGSVYAGDDTTTTVNYMGGSFTCKGYWLVNNTTSSVPGTGTIINLSGDAYVQAKSIALGVDYNAAAYLTITDNAKMYITADGTNTNRRYKGFALPGDLTKDAMVRVDILGSGMLEANYFLMELGGDVSINIEDDGVLKIKDDWQTYLSPLISNDQIIANGGSTTPVVLYDGNYTYVIPEPATLVILGLGGVLLRARKR